MEIERWDLSRLTNGEYAALRRAAGTADFDAAAWRAYYKVDGKQERSREEEDERFTALCMSCLWPKPEKAKDEDEAADADQKGHDGPMPMEECLRHICWDSEGGKPELRESMARRVEALLETRYCDDGYFQGKLLNLVKIIRSDGRYKPYFEKLAKDLRRWNNEKRIVQRRWLSTIYHEIDENDEKNGTEEDTNHDA